MVIENKQKSLWGCVKKDEGRWAESIEATCTDYSGAVMGCNGVMAWADCFRWPRTFARSLPSFSISVLLWLQHIVIYRLIVATRVYIHSHSYRQKSYSVFITQRINAVVNCINALCAVFNVLLNQRGFSFRVSKRTCVMRGYIGNLIVQVRIELV